jgi:hypothetical protein
MQKKLLLSTHKAFWLLSSMIDCNFKLKVKCFGLLPNVHCCSSKKIICVVYLCSESKTLSLTLPYHKRSISGCDSSETADRERMIPIGISINKKYDIYMYVYTVYIKCQPSLFLPFLCIEVLRCRLCQR